MELKIPWMKAEKVSNDNFKIQEVEKRYCVKRISDRL